MLSQATTRRNAYGVQQADLCEFVAKLRRHRLDPLGQFQIGPGVGRSAHDEALDLPAQIFALPFVSERGETSHGAEIDPKFEIPLAGLLLSAIAYGVGGFEESHGFTSFLPPLKD